MTQRPLTRLCCQPNRLVWLAVITLSVSWANSAWLLAQDSGFRHPTIVLAGDVQTNEEWQAKDEKERLELRKQWEADRKNPPTTADEYLQRFHKYAGRLWIPQTKLSAEELTIVVKTLRQEYPFESLHERLAKLQTQQPMTNQSDQRQSETSKLNFKKVLEQPQKVARRSYSFRAEALSELHSEEASRFISKAGAGISRMRTASPSDLVLPEQYAEMPQNFPVGSDLLAEPLVELQPTPNGGKDRFKNFYNKYVLQPNGMPTQGLTAYFHDETAQGFASPDSLGFFKAPNQVAGFDSHRVRMDQQWNGSMRIVPLGELQNKGIQGLEIDWKANRLQLVSLLLNEQPQVYVSDKLPNMEDLSGADVPTRNLDEFEESALEKLHAGEDVITRATPNRILMVGALRAEAACIQCHTDKREGALLGAFSYEFLRDPRIEVPANGQPF